MRLVPLRSIIYSLLLHVLALGLLVVSFDLTPVPVIRPVMHANVVEAVAVDNDQVEAELKRLQEIENEKQKKQQELEKKLAELEKKTADTESKRKLEEKKLSDLKKKKSAEEEKRKQEQKKLEAIKRQQLELEQKQKLEEEKKRKAEAEQKLEEEKRKKEAAEQKRRAEEQRKEQEVKLQRELEEEQRLLEEEQRRQDQSVLNQYIVRITNAIEQEFNTSGLPAGLSCILQIRMIPGGDVVDAQIAKSSGNDIFDRRAEIAVKKAAPLPVPDTRRLFDKMRELRLTFAPQN